MLGYRLEDRDEYVEKEHRRRLRLMEARDKAEKPQQETRKRKAPKKGGE